MIANEHVGDSFEKVLCANCMCLQEYEIITEKEVRIVNGHSYEFNKKKAICKKCGSAIMLPGLEDENERNFEYIYRKENAYIQVEEIQEILNKYNIEKRPLSKVLGMGEHTIERYLEGQLPNKKYSELLYKVMSDYRVMLYYFNTNKGKLTPKAKEKIEEKLEYFERINDCCSPIEKYAIYILNSKYEITNLSLQKLLYYIEGFAQTILGECVFTSRCEAWKYGPVYRHIYDKYKVFGREQIVIDKKDMNEEIDEAHRKLVDYVLKHFGIYNGATLIEFTHAEQPWIEAHAGYLDDEKCEEVITHESIKRYFESVNKKFDLRKDEGVRAYINSLGVV